MNGPAHFGPYQFTGNVGQNSYMKKLSILSVVTLSLLHTKKTHIGAVTQGFLWWMKVIIPLSLGLEKGVNIMCLEHHLFLDGFQLLVEICMSMLNP